MARKQTQIWTKEELLESIAVYKKAIKAVGGGKSYTIGSRRLERQDLAELRNTLDYYKGELAELEGARGPYFVVARPRR